RLRRAERIEAGDRAPRHHRGDAGPDRAADSRDRHERRHGHDGGGRRRATGGTTGANGAGERRLHCAGGNIFHSPFSRTNAISPVSLSSPFWRSTFSVAESPLVDVPLIWNFVPSISLRICLMPPLASPSSICLASIPW